MIKKERITIVLLLKPVLRRIDGLKRQTVTRGWRKLCKKEPNVIKVIRLRRMRWARHTAHIGEIKKSEGVGMDSPVPG
jgi:hypothetical protein